MLTRETLRQEIVGGINKLLKSWLVRLTPQQRQILEAQRDYWNGDDEAIEKILKMLVKR